MDMYKKFETTIVTLTGIAILIGFGFIAYILQCAATGTEVSASMKTLMSIAGIITFPLICLFGGVSAKAKEANESENLNTKDQTMSDQDCNEISHCLVVGSRNFKNYEKMKEILDRYLFSQQNAVIISSDTAGLDALTKKYAKERNYRFICFPTKQDTQGNSANDMRDEEMHQYIAKAVSRGVIVFWDGSSEEATKNMSLAQKYNNPIRVIRCS